MNQGGQFLLRIEDIDKPRCKPTFEEAIFTDLRWLGLSWPSPVLRQSLRSLAYQTALNTLQMRGLTYQCACTRTDIRAALSAPQEGGSPIGPAVLIYPGT
ncbi:MAG TPA: tRNA glutamyl-Q(34) synthetase GluQRS, partial [Rhodobacter sp.]|nr:tRNA glutamyl-Q(34) synthetase GluQRS [Rhodobacter sp.]